MTPEQALSILDNVVAQVSMNRENHFRAQQAAEILKKLIKDTANQGTAKKVEFPRETQKRDNN